MWQRFGSTISLPIHFAALPFSSIACFTKATPEHVRPTPQQLEHSEALRRSL